MGWSPSTPHRTIFWALFTILFYLPLQRGYSQTAFWGRTRQFQGYYPYSRNSYALGYGYGSPFRENAPWGSRYGNIWGPASSYGLFGGITPYGLGPPGPYSPGLNYYGPGVPFYALPPKQRGLYAATRSTMWNFGFNSGFRKFASLTLAEVPLSIATEVSPSMSFSSSSSPSFHAGEMEWANYLEASEEEEERSKRANIREILYKLGYALPPPSGNVIWRGEVQEDIEDEDGERGRREDEEEEEEMKMGSESATVKTRGLRQRRSTPTGWSPYGGPVSYRGGPTGVTSVGTGWSPYGGPVTMA